MNRKMIRKHYDPLTCIEKEIETLEKEIDPLDTAPGINRNTAVSIPTEIGPDMSVFPSEWHLASWGGLSPGNLESAGKKSIRTRKGNKDLKSVL